MEHPLRADSASGSALGGSAPTTSQHSSSTATAVPVPAAFDSARYPPAQMEQRAAPSTNTQPPPAASDKADDHDNGKLPPPALKTIASYVAQHPDRSVKHAMHTVFPKPNPISRLLHRFQVKHSVIDGLTDKEMQYWEAQGPELRRRAGWKLPGEDGPGAEVSPLFWKMYLSLMPTVNRDPLSGMTAPDLLGSTTTMPLSIISLIPDIMKHYAEVIVRAQKEVFLATNYWQ